jgi:hypothetical protein
MNDQIEAGDPRYDGFRVTECFAFLQIDPADNQEGTPTLLIDAGLMAPMLSFDRRHMESLRPIAQDYARQTGRRIRLVRFTQLEEIEAFE